MCETVTCWLLTGRCRVLNAPPSNLGSLLRKSMLPRVKSILLGDGAELLFISVMLDVARRVAWKGCRATRDTLPGKTFVTERTRAALKSLLTASGGRTDGRCPVTTDPLSLGGLTTTTPRFFVVVILTVCPVRLRLCILVKLKGKPSRRSQNLLLALTAMGLQSR